MRNLFALLLVAILVALFIAPSYQRKVDKEFLQYEEVLESIKALRKAYGSLHKKGILRKHFSEEDLMYLMDDDDAEVLFFKKLGKGLKKLGKGAFKFVKGNLPALALGAVTGGVGGVAMAAAKSAAKKVAMKALNKVTKGKFGKIMGGKFGGLISAAAGGFAGGGGLAGAGKALLKAGKRFAVDKAKEFGMKKLDKVTKGKFSQLYGRFGSIAEAGIGGFKNGGGMKGAFKAAAREGKSVLIREGKNFAINKLNKATKGKFGQIYDRFGSIAEAGVNGFKNGGGMRGALRAAGREGKSVLIREGKNFAMKKLNKMTKGKFGQIYDRFGSVAQAGVNGFRNGGGMRGALRAAGREGKSVLIREGKNFAMKKLNKMTKGKFGQIYDRFGSVAQAGVNGFRNGGGMKGALRAAGREGKSVLIREGKNFAMKKLNKMTKGKFGKIYDRFGSVAQAGINGFRNGGGMKGALRAAGREGKSVLLQEGRRRIDKLTKGQFGKFYDRHGNTIKTGIQGLRSGGLKGAIESIANAVQQAQSDDGYQEEQPDDGGNQGAEEYASEEPAEDVPAEEEPADDYYEGDQSQEQGGEESAAADDGNNQDNFDY